MAAALLVVAVGWRVGALRVAYRLRRRHPNKRFNELTFFLPGLRFMSESRSLPSPGFCFRIELRLAPPPTTKDRMQFY